MLSDLDRLPEFSDMTVAVRKGPDRPITTGDRFEQAVKVLSIEFDTDWEVTSVVADTLRLEIRSLHTALRSEPAPSDNAGGVRQASRPTESWNRTFDFHDRHGQVPHCWKELKGP